MKYILRPGIAVIAAILVIDALVLIVRGIVFTWHSYHSLIFEPDAERPLVPALEAVDFFFLSLVFLIMAFGLVQLFIGDLPWLKSISLTWLKIDSFSALKLLLWDTFLVTLLVFFMTRLLTSDTLGWDTLILPGAILMLTVSSFLLKQKH